MLFCPRKPIVYVKSFRRKMSMIIFSVFKSNINYLLFLYFPVRKDCYCNINQGFKKTRKTPIRNEYIYIKMKHRIDHNKSFSPLAACLCDISVLL